MCACVSLCDGRWDATRVFECFKRSMCTILRHCFLKRLLCALVSLCDPKASPAIDLSVSDKIILDFLVFTEFSETT